MMSTPASQDPSRATETGTGRHEDAARRCGLLTNPHSGRNRRRLHAVEKIVAKHPCIHHLVTASVDAIPSALREFADRGTDILAINGGDGTVARVLTLLLRDSPFTGLPRIVLLRGGTTNMNAGDVGPRGGLERALRRLCRWCEDTDRPAEVVHRPVLQVDPGGGEPAVCGMFFGTGAIIQGIEYCQASLHSRGVGSEIGPGLAMARTLWGIVRGDRRFLRPVSVAVGLDAQPAGAAAAELLLLVTSLERLFLGMRPWWGDGDGPLHVSIVRDGARRFLRSLPSLLRGRPGRHATEAAGYRSHDCDTVRLSMDGTWTLDGEMYHARAARGPVTIRSGGTLAFLRM